MLKAFGMNNRFKAIIFLGLFQVSALVSAQEKICTPETLVGKKVKGTVYLNDGDTISGEFIHLTPKNDIRTTHIIFESADKKKAINRMLVIAYHNNNEKDKRYKVYPEKDSVFVKKQCRYDMGVFMLAEVDGPYKLLIDKLKPGATIQAYSQSAENIIYYLRTPDNRLIKLIRNDLKPQLKSIFYNYNVADAFFEQPDFSFKTAAELIRAVNASIEKD